MNWLAGGSTGISAWVANGRGRLVSVNAAGMQWPVTLGDDNQGPSASWMTSLVSAAFGTPRDEVMRTPRGGLSQRAISYGLAAAEAVATAAGLDKAAIVNNSLLSVSPVGPSQLEGLIRATSAAADAWPRRLVVARGIVAELPDIRRAAAGIRGYIFPNRVSYAFDLKSGATPEKINAVRDAALLRKAGLPVVEHKEFTSADILEAHAQYTAVYIGRHGGRNPKFTRAFFEAAHGSRSAQFWGLRLDGALAAFVALRDHGDFISVPLIGYRTDADRKLGLYRQIFALALDIAARCKTVINFGAGAGHYKRLRGGEAVTEYLLIVPPRGTWIGRAMAITLGAAESRLQKLVPQAINAFGG